MVRTLQVALLAAGAIPLVLGLMNFVAGAQAPWLPDAPVTANADNQLRFYAIWFTLPFFLAVWMVLNLRQALPVAIIMFSVMGAAGLARLYSVTQVGWPDPPMIGAMAIEIGFALFIPWIAYVTRRLPTHGDTTASAAGQ